MWSRQTRFIGPISLLPLLLLLLLLCKKKKTSGRHYANGRSRYFHFLTATPPPPPPKENFCRLTNPPLLLTAPILSTALLAPVPGPIQDEAPARHPASFLSLANSPYPPPLAQAAWIRRAIGSAVRNMYVFSSCACIPAVSPAAILRNGLSLLHPTSPFPLSPRTRNKHVTRG